MSVDLRTLYPDPYGGNYDSPADITSRRNVFVRQLGEHIGAVLHAANHLAGFADRRELDDPGLRGFVVQLRDAKAATVAAVDGILERLDGDGDGA